MLFLQLLIEILLGLPGSAYLTYDANACLTALGTYMLTVSSNAGVGNKAPLTTYGDARSTALGTGCSAPGIVEAAGNDPGKEWFCCCLCWASLCFCFWAPTLIPPSLLIQVLMGITLIKLLLLLLSPALLVLMKLGMLGILLLQLMLVIIIMLLLKMLLF
jgi:hypothetical protein